MRTSSLKIVSMPYIQGEARLYVEMSQPFVAHSHDHYVLGRIRKGTRSMICNKEKYSISKGDLIIFNPGDVHECRPCDTHEFMIFDSITFSKSFAGNIQLDGPVLQNIDVLNKLDQIFLLLEGQLAYRRNESTSADMSEFITDAIVETIDNLQKKPLKTQEVPLIADKKISEARSYIENHFTEPVSIDSLAKEAGISVYALIRAYRKRYSITPFQDLISLRVDRACKLLSLGMTPCEAAERIGFCDQAHLTRVFKKRIGTTPAAYAKEVLKGGGAR